MTPPNGPITLLGAGGAAGNELVRLLAARNARLRVVSRNPGHTAGAAEIVAADLTDRDQTIRAVQGSSVVHLLVGLKYDGKVWRELWPRVMANTIEACKRAGAKLIFLDNVYMYGEVEGRMTEQTPFNPCSKKGEVRANLATMLIREWESGNLTASIARSADFYGPRCRNGVANLLVFDRLASGKRPQWIGDDSVPHSFTYTPDLARGLVSLMDSDTSWNRTWHLPTANLPLTGKEFISLAAGEFRADPRYRRLTRPMLTIAGWFDRTVRESMEMLYQNERPYVFDSSKFVETFQFQPTPYPDGIRLTAQAGGSLGSSA